MKDNLGKQIAVEPPVVCNRTTRDELLVVTDDSPVNSSSVDTVGFVVELERAGNRPVRVLHMAPNLTAGAVRRSWASISRAGAVHLQLSQTSLVAPHVIALLIGARFFGRKTSAVITGPTADLDSDSLRRRSFVLRLIDQLAVQSPYLFEQLRRRNVECKLLPMLVADRWFVNRTVEKVQPVILWAGRCEDQSHLNVAVRAYQTVKLKYPRAELLIACPGGREHASEFSADLNGIRCVDIGRLDQLGQAYLDADVFLNTSIIDSQPIAMLRAMASGLPVISASVGSLKQLIKDGESGVLLPLDNHVKFADSIIDLIEIEGLARRLSEGGSKIADRYRYGSGERSWRQFLGLDK